MRLRRRAMLSLPNGLGKVELLFGVNKAMELSNEILKDLVLLVSVVDHFINGLLVFRFKGEFLEG